MASALATRRLTKELAALRKESITNPKITVAPNESNILELHYVIEGSSGTPYHGGIYHGKLLFPKEYPLKPPSVIMLTPSGRFEPKRRLCLSMSDFHPESWNPMWSISTILTGLYSFMLETAPTLGSIETSTSKKRELARKSLDFNMRDPTFRRLFPEYVQLHEAVVAKRRAQGQTMVHDESYPVSASSSSFERPQPMRTNGGNGLYAAAAAGLIAVLSIVFAMRFV